MLAYFPARNTFRVQHRTKTLEKRQPQTSESRDHCRGKVKKLTSLVFALEIQTTYWSSEAYSELNQTSTMGLFCKL